MEKLLKGRGILQERGDVVSLGIFSTWGVENVTTVTFNCILFIVFLFLLIIVVSPCFHCTVLVPVYRVYTSCFHNKVVSSCYRLHSSYLHDAGVTSCFSLNLWFQFILEMCHQSGVHERVHTYDLTCGQFIICFNDGRQCQLHHKGSCIQCHQLC